MRVNANLLEVYINAQVDKVVSELDIKNSNVRYSGIAQVSRTINEITGDEELVRAFILTELVNELGYSANRIEIEREYTAGHPHTNNSRIDMIVRDANGDAFLFIELKSPEAYATEDKDNIIEEQLYKVSGMERTEGHKVQYLVLN